MMIFLVFLDILNSDRLHLGCMWPTESCTQRNLSGRKVNLRGKGEVLSKLVLSVQCNLSLTLDVRGNINQTSEFSDFEARDPEFCIQVLVIGVSLMWGDVISKVYPGEEPHTNQRHFSREGNEWKILAVVPEAAGGWIVILEFTTVYHLNCSDSRFTHLLKLIQVQLLYHYGQ